MSETPLLVMEDISHSYGGAPVLSDVSLVIPRATTLALLGETGSGKSTLARIALGLETPAGGSVQFDGDPITGTRIRRSVRRRMSMVFQDARASLDPRWTVRQSIAEPLDVFRLLSRAVDPTDRVAELMHMVGLPPELGSRKPHQLTGGQAQRAAIARALASDPVLQACDEPTSALDVSLQAHVLNLLRTLQERLGLTMLFISHDVAVVRHMADLVAVLHRGRVVEYGAADAVFARPRHPYTRQALPLKPDAQAQRVLHGVGSQDGCAFRAACPFAFARCAQEVPALHFADGVAVACHAVEDGTI